jgi:hypothetical protein
VETALRFDTHLTEDIVEKYSFSRLPEETVAVLEEHLLICSSCQVFLQKTEEYIRLMKTATAEYDVNQPATSHIRTAAAKPWTRSSAIWGAGLVLLCVTAILPWRLQAPLPAATVALASMRGGEDVQGITQAPAERQLDLAISVNDLSVQSNAYRLELVDAKGRLEWGGIAPVVSGRLLGHVPSRLHAGIYWVRLYSVEGELLREFSLRLQ